MIDEPGDSGRLEVGEANSMKVFEREFVGSMDGLIGRLPFGKNLRVAIGGGESEEGRFVRLFRLINDEDIPMEEAKGILGECPGNRIVKNYLANSDGRRIFARLKAREINKNELWVEPSNDLMGEEMSQEFFGNMEEAARKAGYRFLALGFGGYDYVKTDLGGAGFYLSELKPEMAERLDISAEVRARPDSYLSYDAVKFLDKKDGEEFVLRGHVELNAEQRRKYNSDRIYLDDTFKRFESLIKIGMPKDEEAAVNFSKHGMILNIIRKLNNFADVKINFDKFNLEDAATLYVLMEVACEMWKIQKNEIAMAAIPSEDLRDIADDLALLVLYKDKPKIYDDPDKPFKNPEGVLKINFNHSGIREVPENVFECVNLEELDLWFTKVRTLPERIKDLKKLRRIHIMLFPQYGDEEKLNRLKEKFPAVEFTR